VEQTEEVCEEYAWYDPRGWVCWLITILIKVDIWVVVTVGKWVFHTVCEVVEGIKDFVASVAIGIYDIVVGIFTGDWARVWDGLVEIFKGIVALVLDIFRVVYLGDTIDYIRDGINKSGLRDYVRELLEKKYEGKQLEAVKDALGIDYGAFGFRIPARALRTYVRSDYKSDQNMPPDLILWHEDPNLRINLKELAGFQYSEFWRRFRPEVVPDSGDFSENDLDEYISSRGTKGKAFSVFCMDKGTLQTKLDTASEKAREIGLMLKWKVEDVQVKKPAHVRHNGFDTGVSGQSLVDFLVEIAGRHRKSIDPIGARSDLCVVPAAGIFWYTDNLNGLTVNYRDSDASGLTFKDRIPDFVWKYVLIHEIGHYFGLPHVSGLERIMYSAAEKDETWLSWWLLPEYIYLSGEPGFVFDEAKKVWDYIIEYFPWSCLSVRSEE